jgi:hypothetical protein
MVFGSSTRSYPLRRSREFAVRVCLRNPGVVQAVLPPWLLPGTCAVVGPWYAAAGTGARTVRQHRAGDVALRDSDGLAPWKEDKAWHEDMVVPNGSRRQPMFPGLPWPRGTPNTSPGCGAIDDLTLTNRGAVTQGQLREFSDPHDGRVLCWLAGVRIGSLSRPIAMRTIPLAAAVPPGGTSSPGRMAALRGAIGFSLDGEGPGG